MSAPVVAMRRRRLALAGLAGALLAACAQPPQRTSTAPDHWAGRLGVQVEGNATQSFSAGFELNGSASEGALTLYNPLGNVMAVLQWTAAQAQLRSGDRLQQSASLQALVQELTGTELPIAALFAWLKGEAVQVAGWQADLSRITEGRLVATRHRPEPQATLRIVLER